MPDLPSGTVTFLFTDIEGSTRLLQHLGDRYPDLLAEHQRLLRAAFHEAGGHEVGTQGDSFFVTFTRASDAVTAAVAAQRAVAAHSWPEGGAVRVRMGLHTGEPSFTASGYVGLDVHRAARISAAGHGGQILLSRTTRDLVEHDLPTGASLRDLGEHRLKDLQRPEQVYQLLHPDLPADYPPLKSLDTLPNNLPLQLTSFIGREQVMEEVRRLMATTRLLTLTGTGGSGKTRLSLQVAAHMLEEYPEGVWLVELAALADPALVPQTVAVALGVREAAGSVPGGRSLTQTLVDYLRPRHTLLVLDNCEHLLSACAQLADSLLHACPDLRILTTSRAALGIAGELTYRVPSLSLPDLRRLPPVGAGLVSALTQYEAVRLFIERAIFSQPGFAVTNSNALAVAQVCQRLDGIPLAIELAAARVKLLSVEQIAERLDDRFRLLTGGSRTALPRQQTLRALIDWSYDLLSEAERALFRRLSVFAGGWTLAAAEAVCAGEDVDEYEILDLLGQLVDKSLVMMEEHGGEARFRLLESIRQYGAERLRASPEAAATHDRHGEFYLTLAEQAEPHLTGAEQATWLDRLEKEHVNLRAALGRMVEKGDAESGLRLGAALWRFWHVRGYLREGRARLATALALPSAATCASGRARALNGAGALAHDQGDFEQAEALHRESLAIARECGDRESLAVALNNLGNVALDQGSAAAAATFYQEALALWQELGNMRGIATLLNNLGNVARDRGDYEEATAFFRQSLALQRELGNQRGIASSLNNLGNLAISQGSYESAAALLDESLRGYQALGDSYGIAMALDNLACLALRQGSLKQAGALYRECLNACAELESRPAIAGCLEGLAGVMAARGHPLRAARLYGAAEALRQAAGAPLPDSERLGYDRAIAMARIGIAEITWEAAWKEGRGMSVPQAIAAAADDEPVSPSASQRPSTQGQDEGPGSCAGGADEGATTLMQPVNAARSLPLVT
jgi:predicted ATPase/class 3 adenylate cyclase/Tfp pilus assembly protein PilF